jgi:hypothetical protein
MQTRHLLPCLVLVAAAIVLVVAGVSAARLLTLAGVLACPLMMVLMMRSMAGHDGAHRDSAGAGPKRAS